ncbi:MAG: hypothetical protein AB8B68_00570 [Rickettsiaceae bacterium]
MLLNCFGGNDESIINLSRIKDVTFAIKEVFVGAPIWSLTIDKDYFV